MYKVLLFCAIAFAALTVARPLESGLDLEGLSNKIRSGAVAIANPSRPSDARVQRVVSQDGVIRNLDEDVIGPNGEVVEQGGRTA